MNLEMSSKKCLTQGVYLLGNEGDTQTNNSNANYMESPVRKDRTAGKRQCLVMKLSKMSFQLDMKDCQK